MITYDPEVIQRFADKLYVRAATAIWVSAILGVIIGLMVGPFLIQSLPASVAVTVPIWISPILLGLLGFVQGMERAATLKIQAQTALCQLQIERNTKRA